MTIWFDEESIAKWHHSQPSGRRGRPQDYSDTTIICALTLRNLFRLPLHNKPIHLVVDSTVIKIFGEGEWKMRQYGKEKRRTWRKLHIAVDECSQDIVMPVISDANVHDGEVLRLLLPSKDELSVSQVAGDGAYDSHDCYTAAINIGALPCFSPRINAARHKPTDEAWRLRNRVVGRVRHKGLKKWKQKNNYHRRSLAETAFSKLKKIFGGRVASHRFENQAIELALRCHILNKMNQLGMPDSFRK